VSRDRAIPIIKLYDNLIVSIQLELSDSVVLQLKMDLAEEIRRHDVHNLIIDVSGVDIFDTYIARSIRDIANISRLMGVGTILAGLDAGMAITLVEMGMALNGIETALNLEAALELQNETTVQQAKVSHVLLGMLDGLKEEKTNDSLDDIWFSN
jgi:rsbT antagonist protein RsbS